ncbi:MAG: phage major capsid protein, partial [Lachnospiraceae bacterium]|nr:phage major capsid protein [Lachnospiraceae bacterium]
MSKELREMLDSINAMKNEVKDLYADGKDAEAEAKMAELEKLQAKFENLLKLEDTRVAPPKDAKPIKDTDPIHAFAEAARHGFQDTVDPMREGSNADGGYTVPEDIQTQIQHYKEANFSLRQLVSVENVTTNKGARTYQTKAKAPGFQKVAENGAMQQVAGPTFERITYTIEDYA